MIISSIESQRDFNHLAYWQIVYEWENIFSKINNIPLKARNQLSYYLRQMPLVSNLIGGYRFYFDMSTRVRREIPILHASSAEIPYIIDFWVSKDQLPSFVNAYKKAPIVFVSSMEAYDFLKENDVPVNIRHLGISIPDHTIDELNCIDVQKEYDLVMAGRESRVFKEYVKEYVRRNPDASILYRNDGNVYVDLNGNEVCKADTRHKYLELLKKSRAFVYSTPGIDDDKHTNGYSQVTPRFLEAVAAGCNMLLRYKKNSDIDYFNLQQFGPSITSYEEFESLMKNAVNTPPLK